MSVLVEGISVIVRNETLERKFPGGVWAYARSCPNQTFCTDQVLTRIGFMVPLDVGFFISGLEHRGLVWADSERRFVDIAVVDQLHGPTATCDWLLSGHHRDGFSLAWLVGTEPDQLAVPRGWRLEESLSKHFIYTPTSEAERWRAPERHRDGRDLFIDPETGKETVCGRPFGPDETDYPN